MDRGAHFHRCDFQVHTPRDINWSGPRPETDSARSAYAERFVETCRKKGVGAVAITDHHDFTFFSYIKEAANNETDSHGAPIPNERKLVVFPGMELTLGIPCQAILILDVDFPVDLLSSIYPVLGITPNDRSEPCHPEIRRLDHLKSFSDIYRALGNLDYLRDKFILLPNVGESGNFSVLRKGFQAHYKAMPCVGGYVDGSLTKLGTGNAAIVAGEKKEWGFKRLGLFQTSDNRRDDFQDLGTHVTWVKWAVPTAEALRQACLAPDTRISQSEPELPSTIIESVQVSNSKFLGPFRLELNPQYNAMIGGRGTGKSTILEYLRWALCDQPPTSSPEDELPDYQKKRQSLIQKTLLCFDAVVTVTFQKHGVRHIVQKNSRTNELSLKIADGEYNPCSESDIRRLLPIQAFSQKQLSAVGARKEELSRFVEAPAKQQMADFTNQVEELKSRVRTAHELIQRKRTLENEVTRLTLEIKSLENQLPELRKKLKGLSEDDQKVLSVHDDFVKEQTTIHGWANELDELRRVASDAVQELANMPSYPAGTASLPNADTITDIHTQVDLIFKVANAHLAGIIQLLDASPEDSPLQSFEALRGTWQARFGAHTAQYTAVKQATSANETVVNQVNQIEGRIRLLTKQLQDTQTQLSRQGTPEDAYRTSRTEWTTLYRERADLLQAECDELTSLSKGKINATLKRGANVAGATKGFIAILAGTNIRKAKVETLFANIVGSEEPVEKWERVLEELDQLALLTLGESDAVELPATPLLSAAGFNGTEIERIARTLTLDQWLSLSLAELADQPSFEYVRGDNDRIMFSDASAGQQATALLTALLNQEGPPLIIDQPEEDLDNPTMPDIVREVWNAKTTRQVIFTSHNANIVVNGDADLILCCEYRTAGDQTLGEIKYQGAIDVGPVNDVITTVMEGGKAAFDLRKQKYGF
ncbi:MAG: AAA family ATPase [Planctomycetes bacterium]|nr:AAA family ATPase [Planctomycetota bacterium]